MKVLLYSEMMDQIGQSGLDQAIYHQAGALDRVGIAHTQDPDDSFDILHINTYFPRSYLLAKECQLKKIPIVYHAHSTQEDFRKSFKGSDQMAPFFKKWISTCYRLGDAIITPTEYSKGLLEGYGLDRPIYPISNGIDLEDFGPIEDARASFCRKYSFSKDDFIVMGIGLYIERKGILDFIELARLLPDYKFIWFGHTDRDLVPKHVQRAIDTRPGNLTLAGYVAKKEISLALQGVDVFAMTSWEETEGIPALEACASRTQMIVRDIPVFQGWLEDGYNVYKARDLKHFKELLIQMEAGQLEDLTDRAYEVAKARDLGQVGLGLKKVYEKLLAGASSPIAS